MAAGARLRLESFSFVSSLTPSALPHLQTFGTEEYLSLRLVERRVKVAADRFPQHLAILAKKFQSLCCSYHTPTPPQSRSLLFWAFAVESSSLTFDLALLEWLTLFGIP